MKMRLTKYIQAFTEAAATVHLGSDSVAVGSFYVFATITCGARFFYPGFIT